MNHYINHLYELLNKSMLIETTPAELFTADSIKDIEDNYKKLVGNLVFVKDEKTVYVVLPKKPNRKRKLTTGRIINVHCTEERWKEIVKKEKTES